MCLCTSPNIVLSTVRHNGDHAQSLISAKHAAWEKRRESRKAAGNQAPRKDLGFLGLVFSPQILCQGNVLSQLADEDIQFYGHDMLIRGRLRISAYIFLSSFHNFTISQELKSEPIEEGLLATSPPWKWQEK